LKPFVATNGFKTPKMDIKVKQIPKAVHWIRNSKKGKGFPYSLPSVGPGADPGVQAVSPQVT